jgi:hypothetical protein
LVVKITGGIAPAAAVFALNPESDTPTECANDFFSDLFKQKLILAGRLLLPLPDALDAIKLMQAAATTGNQLANRSQFLSENAREWALSTGLLMREHLAKGNHVR